MTVCDGSLSWTHNTETLSTNGMWTMHHATELHWFVWRLLWPMWTLRLIIIQKGGKYLSTFFDYWLRDIVHPQNVYRYLFFPLWINPVFPKLFSPKENHNPRLPQVRFQARSAMCGSVPEQDTWRLIAPPPAVLLSQLKNMSTFSTTGVLFI